MTLKTYQAFTMAEALAAVKRDLGDDAVILNTRSYQRGGFLGLGRKTIVEVTASTADESASPPEVVKRKAPANARARAAAQAYENTPAPTAEDFQKTQRLAQAMLEQHERRQVSAPTRPEVVPDIPVPESEPAAIVPEAPKSARRFTMQPMGDGVAVELKPSSRISAPPAPDMRDELSSIRQMVGQVLQRQVKASGAPSPTMPGRLFDMYLHLIGQDLSDELADKIVNEVRDELTELELEDDRAVRDAVRRRLSQFIPAAEEPIPAAPTDGRPLTIALVGPTGVGKTTTLAKLAASFKLKQQKRVGLITADTFRIAAVDQLRTYANIIDLPLEVALTPDDMRQAINALRDCEVILIDTAGRSQNDTDRLVELKQFIDAACPHEVHLVLSGTAGEKVLLREAEVFSEVGVDRIVLTKLDEAVSFGVLVNVVRRVGKEISFFTTGQEVPDHLEVGRPDRLAQLVVGAVGEETRA